MRAPWKPCLLLLVVTGCAAPQGQPVATSQTQPCMQEGMASWYDPAAGRRPAADGERHDAASLTAAHRSLPFGTQVRVTNLDTGRSVVVRISDRGPVAHDRIIDLSVAAATALAMRQGGVAHVRLELAPASDPSHAPALAGADTTCPLPRTTES
jgi:rare lipoprotein A